MGSRMLQSGGSILLALHQAAQDVAGERDAPPTLQGCLFLAGSLAVRANDFAGTVAGVTGFVTWVGALADRALDCFSAVAG